MRPKTRSVSLTRATTAFIFFWVLTPIQPGFLAAQPPPAPPGNPPIVVFAGQAVVRSFDSPISVTVADADIAEVSAALATSGSQKFYSIRGKKLGKTSLIVTQSSPAQSAVYAILVIRDPTKRSELENFITTSF